MIKSIFLKNLIALNVCFILFTMCQNNKDIKKNNSTKIDSLISMNNANLEIINDTLVKIDIDKLKIENHILFSSIFDRFNLLPLETKKECLIGEINQIEIFDDTIYVLDSNIAKGLFLFDINGKFIKKIGRIGKGLGEYFAPSFFSLDPKTKNIFILDSQFRKFIVYSGQGNLIQEMKLLESSIPLQIAYNDNYIYIDELISPVRTVNYLLYAIDKTGKISERWFPYKIYQKGFLQPFNLSRNFFRTDNDIKYAKLFCDTIFSLKGSKIKPVISITTNNKISEEEMYEMNQCKNLEKFIGIYVKCRKFLGISNYIESSKTFMFKFQNYRETHNLFYYPENSEVYCTTNLIDDLTLQTDIEPFYFGYKNHFVSCIQNKFSENIETLIKNVKENRINLSKEEKSSIEKLNPNCNPVLVIYDCRENFGIGDNLKQ